jgi:hypothetical protein
VVLLTVFLIFSNLPDRNQPGVATKVRTALDCTSYK